MNEANTRTNEDIKTLQKPETENAAIKQEFLTPVLLSNESKTVPQDDQNSTNVEEQKLQELLMNLSEEILQLNGFMIKETGLIDELSSSLKEILKKLRISFSIPQQDVLLARKARKIVLTEEAHLTVTYESGETNSAFLAEYPAEVVAATLWSVLPELKKSVTLRRKLLSTRISFFEGIKKELTNIARSITAARNENFPSGKDGKT